MINITDLAQRLKKMTQWQKTPTVVAQSEYIDIVTDAVKTLFIDTGRASMWNNELLIVDDNGYVVYDSEYRIDEEKYILLCAQVLFFQKVQTDVNNMVSYTTDALSVTNADKPYAHLKDTIDKLQNERRIVFYKLSPYIMGYDINPYI